MSNPKSDGNFSSLQEFTVEVTAPDAAEAQRERYGPRDITTLVEYEKAQADLKDLQDRLDALLAEYPVGLKGYSKASLRRLIARLNEDLSIFEAFEEARLDSE